MLKPRIDSIRVSKTPARRQPSEGDIRWLKGRNTLQIRQMRIVPAGHPHAGAHVVSNGRQLYEWVDRGSESDRAWQATLRDSDENSTQARAYFECGCLCIIEGKVEVRRYESNARAVKRYMAECACSRHPEYKH